MLVIHLRFLSGLISFLVRIIDYLYLSINVHAIIDEDIYMIVNFPINKKIHPLSRQYNNHGQKLHEIFSISSFHFSSHLNKN